jgi:hypothetical protein
MEKVETTKVSEFEFMATDLAAVAKLATMSAIRPYAFVSQLCGNIAGKFRL